MAIYQIAGKNVDFFILQQEQINDELRIHHNKRANIVCHCYSDDEKKMSVFERNGNYGLRKYPNTGKQHHKLCQHFSLTANDLARMGYELDVISSNEDEIKVSLTVSLKEGTGSIKVTNKSWDFTGRNRIVSNRMTLLGLLHLLWEKAGLNNSKAIYDAKQIWQLIRQAAYSVYPNGIRGLSYGLSEILLIPTHPETLNQAKRNWQTLSKSLKAKRHVLFMVKLNSTEVQELNLSSENCDGFSLKQFFGQTVKLASRDAKVILENFCKSYADELNYATNGADLVLFGVARSREYEKNIYAEIQSLAAMPLACGYIPFDSSYERLLTEELVKQERVFEKPLRYDAKKDFQIFPDFILKDCGQPVVIEVYGMTTPEYIARKTEKREIYASEGYPYECWEWEATTNNNISIWLENNPLPEIKKEKSVRMYYL